MRKKKMIKVICLGLTAVLVFSLIGCGKGNADEGAAGAVKTHFGPGQIVWPEP